MAGKMGRSQAGVIDWTVKRLAGAVKSREQEATSKVYPKYNALHNDEPRSADWHSIGLDAVENIDDAAEESRDEEGFGWVCDSAREGAAEHDEACADQGCESDEQHQVVNEDCFADGLQACELVGLGVEQSRDTACRHGACEPCEREIWTVRQQRCSLDQA
ncbi:hypothetical protein LTS12_027143 [Elasticomyces elasticus]|nr:hypothetical protein LTS12_027143 [Elasticomyces elasticus]